MFPMAVLAPGNDGKASQVAKFQVLSWSRLKRIAVI
jgi:hypothetical protein